MKIHNDYITVQTKQLREFQNITANVRAAMEKSGIREGMVLVAALHSNSAVFLNDDESGLLQDVEKWLEKLAPAGDTYQHVGRFESAADVHLKSLLLGPSVTLGITDGRLEMGPWQHVIYAELDGQRPKRILIKVMGE